MLLHRINAVFAIVIIALCCLPVSQAAALGSVTVMADNSMGLAVAEIARNYSAKFNIVVNTSFSVPIEQQAQITEGVAVDVLITPEAEWIEQLKTQGLIDIYSPTVIAKNSLVLVGPLSSSLNFGRGSSVLPTAAIIRDIGSEPGFVVPHPETLMEGAYSKEAVRSLDPGGYLEPYTLYIKQLGQMFSMVSNRDAYGLFLYSSTIHRTGIKVIGQVAEEMHRPIQYYAVVIAGENMDEARRFLEYLKSKEVQAIFKDNGFGIN